MICNRSKWLQDSVPLLESKSDKLLKLLQSCLTTLRINIRLGRKYLLLQNTPAYFEWSKRRKRKGFMKLTPKQKVGEVKIH
jgi:hypothetical protein